MKRDMWTSFTILAFVFAIITSQAKMAQGQMGELTARVDRNCAFQGDIITVTGRIIGVTTDQPILIQVQDPRG